MSKFHATVSRRDFMKSLGLAGAGLGAAIATAPVFHDLDEVMSSPKAVFNRAWYVKERDFGDYTIEIDWTIMKRRDLRGFANWVYPITMQHYPGGPQAFLAAKAAGEEKVDELAKEFWPDYTGPTTRDKAFEAAIEAFAYDNSKYVANIEQGGMPTIAPAPRPEEIGMTKWQGTPEDNLLMVRAVLSILGLGPPIGVAELNEQNKKFVWEYTSEGRHIIIDDSITEQYRTEDPLTVHIPSSHKYVIATHNLSCDEVLRRGLNHSFSTEDMSYARVAFAKNIFEQFIRGLGYNIVYGHRFQSAPAWDMASGVGEHCRMGQITGSPEYGGLMRTHAVFYTDLPLAYTKPIDAGFAKFCETCGTCAETCPVGAIPERGVDRNWESFTGQEWANDKQEGGTEVMYNIPGYKGWRCNLFECAYTPCGSACKGNCPFNTIPDGSFIHSMVKATVSTTSIFNSFFTSMESFMHFGKQEKDPESWWEHPEQWPVYGTNPNSLRQ